MADRLVEEGDFPQAIFLYDRALAAQPLTSEDRSGLLYARGFAKGRLKDHDGAIADYRAAKALAPGNVKVLSSLCYQLQKKGDLDEALEHCNQALRFDPQHASTYGVRGLIWQAKQNFPEAQRDLDHALRLDPENWASYYNRAQMFAEWGRPELARRDYKAAYDRAPGWARARESVQATMRHYGIIQ